mgnify:CR=1 FL=1
MKFTLLVVGRTVEKHYITAINDYAERTKHYISFDIEVIPELKNTKSLSMEQQKEKEGELLVFLHYPPIFGQEVNLPILETLLEFDVSRVYYGNIHASGCSYALNGVYQGIDFRLISSDFLYFNPIKIEKSTEKSQLF